MELHQITALSAVVRHGGFAPAARARGVAPSSLTRAVASLEASLGVRLLQRTTRRVALTEAGERFLARAIPATEELEEARTLATDAARGPTGQLRLAASVAYGLTRIVPRLPGLRARYPDLTVDLLLADERMDLIGRRIDLAVRHGHLPDSELVARRLRAVTYRLVAAPAYLRRAGCPKTPSDLSRHDALGFDFAPFRDGWRLSRVGARGEEQIEVAPRFALVSSNALALRSWAAEGCGIALLADWLVDDDVAAGRLSVLLPDWRAEAAGAPPDPALWLVTPSRAFVPAKVRVAEAFLRESENEAWVPKKRGASRSESAPSGPAVRLG